MTYETLPGVYFEEVVKSRNTQTSTPLFIIEGATTTTLDDKLTQFTSYDECEEALTDSELPQTLQYIKDAVDEMDTINSKIYIYKIGNETSNNYYNAMVTTANYKNIQDVFYIEETKGTMPISQKIIELQRGAEYCAKIGTFRIVYTTPYGTITDALTTDSDKAKTMINTIQSEIIDKKICYSRAGIILPDEHAGLIMGRISITPYNIEVGRNEFNTKITGQEIPLDYTQMLTLQNMGILFIRLEPLAGEEKYRINLGVTTGFYKDTYLPDSLLTSRRIADQVLREIGYVCEEQIKNKETQGTLTFLQGEIDVILDQFITNEEIIEEGTQITVSQGESPYTAVVSGTIQPIDSIIGIKVSTTLQ